MLIAIAWFYPGHRPCRFRMQVARNGFQSSQIPPGATGMTLPIYIFRHPLTAGAGENLAGVAGRPLAPAATVLPPLVQPFPEAGTRPAYMIGQIASIYHPCREHDRQSRAFVPPPLRQCDAAAPGRPVSVTEIPTCSIETFGAGVASACGAFTAIYL